MFRHDVEIQCTIAYINLQNTCVYFDHAHVHVHVHGALMITYFVSGICLLM